MKLLKTHQAPPSSGVFCYTHIVIEGVVYLVNA